jgi:hypothetical protein
MGEASLRVTLFMTGIAAELGVKKGIIHTAVFWLVNYHIYRIIFQDKNR